MFRTTRLFILYMVDLKDHILEHGISLHVFAVTSSCTYIVVTMIQHLPFFDCIKEVSRCVSANYLKLNVDKIVDRGPGQVMV